MAHKKYYGYQPKWEHYETVLYQKEGAVGSMIDFVYDNGRCGMNHYGPMGIVRGCPQRYAPYQDGHGISATAPKGHPLLDRGNALGV